MCHLTTMRLSGLMLTRGFADDVAAASPLLETLHIDDCRYEFGRLASRSLKKLSMDRCTREFQRIDKLVLAVPCITSLRFYDHEGVSAPISLEGEMPNLNAASLTCPRGARGLLSSLQHTWSLSLSRFCAMALLPKSLHLSWFWAMALHDDEELKDSSFPVFHNLRTLLLDQCDLGVECQVLQRFLRNSPRLETLIVRNCKFSGAPRSRKRKARSEKTCSCGWQCWTLYDCKNLKSIELEFEEGCTMKVLADVMERISKPRVPQIQTSVHDGKRKVIISFM